MPKPRSPYLSGFLPSKKQQQAHFDCRARAEGALDDDGAALPVDHLFSLRHPRGSLKSVQSLLAMRRIMASVMKVSLVCGVPRSLCSSVGRD